VHFARHELAALVDEIRAFLHAEMDLLDNIVVEGMSMIDVGCGTGRHLTMLRNRLRTGVGVDDEHAYVVDARRRGGACRLHFVTGDATCVPIGVQFDLAVCNRVPRDFLIPRSSWFAS
jgi:ubiquinone/menaquinone biosynthesis C-methylase UbiE